MAQLPHYSIKEANDEAVDNIIVNFVALLLCGTSR
jgi:hypothetical protein